MAKMTFRSGNKVVYADPYGDAFTGVVRDTSDDGMIQVEYKVAGRAHTVWTSPIHVRTWRNYEG